MNSNRHLQYRRSQTPMIVDGTFALMFVMFGLLLLASAAMVLA